MADPFISYNGSIHPADTALVPTQDRGLLYGDGVFETIRLYNGIPFRLYAHWERLCASAAELRFPMLLTYEAFDGTIQELLKANERRDGVLRITVTRGAAHPGLDPHPGAIPTILMNTAAPRKTLRSPCRVVTVSARRDERSLLSRIKSVNYLPNILARFEVKDKDADEGLLLNTAGAVAEGTVSNVFWVRGNLLYTPSVDCGVLPGITRSVVLEIAEEAGLLVAEGTFNPVAPTEAEAIFLTNSLAEIVVVGSLDGRSFGDRVHPAVERLQDAFRQVVTAETG